MKAEEIVIQLRGNLPTVTDLFSVKVNITSLTRSGTTVTAATSSPHNLSIGDGVTVTGGKTPIDISSLTYANGVATATTATAHDLTELFENGKPSDTPQVEVQGATEAEYNGTHDLLSVPSRFKFTYSVSGTPSSPATGTPQLLEQPALGYNGPHVVATVPDTTTFTYEITKTPQSPAQGSPVAHVRVRASASVSVEQAISSYTRKTSDTLWAFVVLGDTSVSKNRHIASDETDTKSAGSALRQRLISPFSVFVFVPTSEQLSARAARDQMEDVRFYMLRSLLNSRFAEAVTSKSYKVTYAGDGFFQYTGGYYIHQFLFESTTDIIDADGVDPDYNVAFRDVALSFIDEFETEELSVNVNLDDEVG